MTSDKAWDAGERAALEAMLPLVPEHGWTRRALAEGLRAAGADSGEAALHFPGGTPDMIGAFFDRALTTAVAAAAPQVGSEIRLTKRVRALVAALLDALEPDKEAARRALAWAILPHQAPRFLRIVAKLADGIWEATGDQAADFSRHTKRATLAAILVPTLLFWLGDYDFEHAATLAFFDRRLQGVGRIGRLRARVTAGCRGGLGRRRAAA